MTGKSRWLVVATIAWTVAVGYGIRELVVHETTAGVANRAPAVWPAASRLPRGEGATLVMFVHSNCPCTRASLGELANVARNTDATILIVFAEVGGSYWDDAGRIPNAVRVVAADEATRFGAATSGHTVVYDRAGALRFAGGITGSRGHAGDNVGRQAVERLLAGDTDGPTRRPVFGCAMEAS